MRLSHTPDGGMVLADESWRAAGVSRPVNLGERIVRTNMDNRPAHAGRSPRRPPAVAAVHLRGEASVATVGVAEYAKLPIHNTYCRPNSPPFRLALPKLPCLRERHYAAFRRSRNLFPRIAFDESNFSPRGCSFWI